MCEAPSTWRARTCLIVPSLRIAAYRGLIAAPGRPNAWVAPSFSRISTAASIARIFAMSVVLAVRGAAAGELLDEQQQGGVVEPAVPLGAGGADELSGECAERDGYSGLACGRGHDAHVLVVQVDPEAGGELALEHVRRLALQDLVARQAPGQDLDRGFHV